MKHVNNTQHSASASGSRFNESPRRSTRKCARLSIETDGAHSPPTPASDHVELSTWRRSSANQSIEPASKVLTLPDWCWGNIAGAGYSFSLRLLDKTDQGEEEWLYDVLSPGTFARVAPERSRVEVKVNMSICQVFFEKLSRVIKLC